MVLEMQGGRGGGLRAEKRAVSAPVQQNLLLDYKVYNKKAVQN